MIHSIMKSTAAVWFCLVVTWLLAELIETGVQYADPVLPCFLIALPAGVVYSLIKTLEDR